MRHLSFVACLFLAVTMSCEYHDKGLYNSCEVANPVEDLPWLKNIITDYETTPGDITKFVYFVQGVYQAQTVFIHLNCCPFCMSVAPVLDCNGELLFYYGEPRSDQIKNQKVIWKASDSACNF